MFRKAKKIIGMAIIAMIVPTATSSQAVRTITHMTAIAEVTQTVEKTSEETTEAIVEVTIEAATNATIETTVELTAKATTELTTEATTELTAEATTELTAEAATELTTEATNEPEPVEIDIYPEMDISQTTGISEEQFVSMMDELWCDYEGYFSRNASHIWNLCQKYEIHEIAFCGIIAQESGWGQVECGDNNYFGIIGADYQTEKEGLDSFASLLGEEYLDPQGDYYVNTTLSGVETYYSQPGWCNAVYDCMCTII